MSYRKICINPNDLLRQSEADDQPPWDNFDGRFDYDLARFILDAVRDGAMEPRTDEFSAEGAVWRNYEHWTNVDHYRRIAHLALRMEAGERLEPIDIDLWWEVGACIEDGYHRVYAVSLLGLECIEAIIISKEDRIEKRLAGCDWRDAGRVTA